MVFRKRFQSSDFTFFNPRPCKIFYMFNGHPFTTVAYPDIPSPTRRRARLEPASAELIPMLNIITGEPVLQLRADGTDLIEGEVDVARHLEDAYVRRCALHNKTWMTSGETSSRRSLHESPRSASHDNFTTVKPMAKGDWDEARLGTGESLVMRVDWCERVGKGEWGEWWGGGSSG